MKKAIKKLKNLKLNFRLTLIVLLSVSIVLLIIISITSPRQSTFVPFIPSGEANFEIPKNTLIQNSSDAYFYNDDTITISKDKTTAQYFYYDTPPSQELIEEIKNKLGVSEVEIYDNSYKKVKENLQSDPYLDGTFQELPTE